MRSTYVRNFFSTAALMIVSFLMIGTAFGIVSRNVFVDEMQEQVLTSARETARTAAAYGQEDSLLSLDLRMTLSTVAASTGEHIFITDPEGTVISCSDRAPRCRHDGMRLSESVRAGLPRESGVTFRDDLEGFYTGPHFTAAEPLTAADGTVLGYLFVSRDSREALAVWQDILPPFIMITLVVMALALAFGLASSRMLTLPLREMANAARQFGRGDLSARVEVQRDDEIGELAEAFNSMADSLEKSEQRRREFIANVSHELKTPMTTIAGFADGILDGTIPPQSEKKYLQTISSETKRLARLVRSMLELSRLQAGDRTELLNQSFDVAEVLRLTLINFADKIDQRRLDVDFQVPEDSILVRGNADAITQVVYNLFDNAIKFAKEGTELGISLWKDNAKAYVSVRNHGSTIPEAEIPLLFDRFHKSDRSRSQDRDGVGLGLYIVKTILNNHGEDIAVTSRQGVTDFVFTLALKQETSKKQTGDKQHG